MNVTNCLYFPVFSFNVSPPVIISSALAICLTIVLSLVASLGNLLVIIVIFKTRELQTNGNLLICFLAVTDLLVGLVVQPLFIAFELTTILERPPNCPVVVVYTMTRVLGCILSLMTVLIISLERSLAIFKPFRYTTLVSKRRLVGLILVIWFFWALVVSSRFIGMTTKPFRIMVSSVIIISHFITGFTYVRIQRLASRHIQHIQAQMCSVAQSTDRKTAIYYRESRALRTTTLIIGCIFLCYAPIVGVLITNIVSRLPAPVSHMMFTWADTLAYLNSSLNPLIYCLRNAEFRRGISSILRLKTANNLEDAQQMATETSRRISKSTIVKDMTADLSINDQPVLLRFQYINKVTTQNEISTQSSIQ